MKKKHIMIICAVVFVLVFFVIFRFGGEDSWIKDENGVYIEHGSPSKIPEEVLEQQELILEALKMYYEEDAKGTQFESQCLGTVGDYAVDIVHVPRTEEDNLEENQCAEYRSGEVGHFIELDIKGNVVRIV